MGNLAIQKHASFLKIIMGKEEEWVRGRRRKTEQKLVAGIVHFTAN